MSTKPLAGVKVVDFSMAASGPACTKLLAEWGADVVKIEIFGGEMMRFRPFELHEWANMNKREIVCNVKSDEGRELVYKLCKESDFFITNYRTKALQKLKLDYESISAQNPGIVYGSVTGYGDYGPEAETPGYDVTAFWARTGLLYELVEKGTSPLVSPLGIGDYALATAFTGPLMAAYIEKQKTGNGEHVSASLYSFGLYVNQWYVMRPQADASFQYPVSRKNVKEPMSNCFRTKDDQWFQMTVFDFERYFPILMEIAGRTDVLGQPGYQSFADITENHNAVTEILDAGFAQYDFDELAKIFDQKNIAYAKINLPGDVLEDEQAWANHYLYTHEFRDGYKMIMPSSPFKFGVNEAPDHEWAPRLGENTEEVMKELGYSDEQIRDYVDRKIVDILRTE